MKSNPIQLKRFMMLRYCPNPAFDGFIALPKDCDVDAVVQRFKEDYNLYDLGDWLWKLAEAALTHDDFDSDERKDVIHFVHELECVMEVVYLGKVRKYFSSPCK
jgi:hypothetical protein